MSQRIHIFGASGSGTSTLGRALATARSSQFFDTDDFFWEPTDPPFTVKRDVARRLDLMGQVFLPRRNWILCGSLTGWGDALIPFFDLVVFLRLDPVIRLDRLERRETRRHGAEAIAPDGARYYSHLSFMDWARRYDDPGFEGRSLVQHRTWLDALPCPVLELDADQPVASLVDAVNRQIGGQ